LRGVRDRYHEQVPRSFRAAWLGRPRPNATRRCSMNTLKTAADVRAFLNHRAAERPRNEAPVVSLEGTVARLRLFDPIDSWGEWWGMSAKDFAAALDELPAEVDTLELLINSPGGDVFDGLAIVNTMRAHSARTVATVQGIAASAASFIAAAA